MDRISWDGPGQWRTAVDTVVPDEGDKLSLVKKGSRLITVDGVVYRWRVIGSVRCCVPCSNGVSDFAVQRVGRRSAVLLAGTSAFPVVPSVVEAGVRAALGRGWRSMETGPAFSLGELV